MDNSETNRKDRPDLGRDLQGFLERVLALTPEQRVGYLVSAGINTKDGKLTKAYHD